MSVAPFVSEFEGLPAMSKLGDDARFELPPKAVGEPVEVESFVRELVEKFLFHEKLGIHGAKFPGGDEPGFVPVADSIVGSAAALEHPVFEPVPI